MKRRLPVFERVATLFSAENRGEQCLGWRSVLQVAGRPGDGSAQRGVVGECGVYGQCLVACRRVAPSLTPHGVGYWASREGIGGLWCGRLGAAFRRTDLARCRCMLRNGGLFLLSVPRIEKDKKRAAEAQVWVFCRLQPFAALGCDGLTGLKKVVWSGVAVLFAQRGFAQALAR